jgi:glycosyltransferase involved in cell wall biosynthesis
MTVAVVHDVALEDGGGMNVVRTMCDVLDADLYVGIAAEGVLDPDEVELCSGLGRAIAKRSPTVRGLYNTWRFQSIPVLEEYDVVVASGCGTDWYTPGDEQALVRYVHSPAPLVYHEYHRIADSALGRLNGMVSRTLRAPTHRFPDVWLANSDQTRRRLRHYVDVDADVLYPPVSVEELYADERGDYHLLISRLTERKRVLETVRAFDAAGESLVVVGEGPIADRVATTAEDSDCVTFRGWVEEEEKRSLLASARSVVVPSGVESFGIVAVEAFASGAPVVCRHGGFLDHLVRDGWNGVQYEDGVVEAARSADACEATVEELQAFAEEFSESAFAEQLEDAVETARERNSVRQSPIEQ